MCDHFLHICYFSLDAPVSLNDINILDGSSTGSALMSGTFTKKVPPYTINGRHQDWMYFLADGSYPCRSIFFKTLGSPSLQAKLKYTKRQDHVRKDAGQCFGVLVHKFAFNAYTRVFTEFLYFSVTVILLTIFSTLTSCASLPSSVSDLLLSLYCLNFSASLPLFILLTGNKSPLTMLNIVPLDSFPSLTVPVSKHFPVSETSLSAVQTQPNFGRRFTATHPYTASTSLDRNSYIYNSLCFSPSFGYQLTC